MRQEFNQIYDKLFSNYLLYSDNSGRRPYIIYDELVLERIIKTAIDGSDPGGLLRSDAKYFLLINFHQLIVRPMIESSLYRGEIESQINLGSIEEAITSDIQTIVDSSIESRENKLNSNDNQISGHQIMATIDRVWKQLKTTAFDIWG